MSPQFEKAKEDLLYAGYAYNRVTRPEILLETWARVYGDVTELETRYQAEIRKENSTPDLVLPGVAKSSLLP